MKRKIIVFLCKSNPNMWMIKFLINEVVNSPYIQEIKLLESPFPIIQAILHGALKHAASIHRFPAFGHHHPHLNRPSLVHPLFRLSIKNLLCHPLFLHSLNMSPPILVYHFLSLLILWVPQPILYKLRMFYLINEVLLNIKMIQLYY